MMRKFKFYKCIMCTRTMTVEDGVEFSGYCTCGFIMREVATSSRESIINIHKKIEKFKEMEKTVSKILDIQDAIECIEIQNPNWDYIIKRHKLKDLILDELNVMLAKEKKNLEMEIIE